MEKINIRIQAEFCNDTYVGLSDTSLMDEYRNCKSVQNEISKLTNVLAKFVDTNTIPLIINEYMLELIPAGTKAVIRGNKFNKVIQTHIENIGMNDNIYEIRFEQKCAAYPTSEIPDWYILDKTRNRILIGMNQLDLISGGQQLNRGYKYLVDNKHNTENSKLLCVICNPVRFTSDKNKAFRLFEIGYENNTLCYLKNLSNIIHLYFA
jgi:hypothetical protein